MHRHRLFDRAFDVVLGQHLREACDVVDVLLGIDRRQRTAELLQRFDDLRPRAT